MASFSPIPLEEFEARTGIGPAHIAPAWGAARNIVALRDLARVEAVQAMPRDYLARLIANVGLEGRPDEKPYAGREIALLRADPSSLLVAQTFVERSKYRRILENMSGVFDGFCMTRGIAKLTASIILGRDAAGAPCIAHYLPPLIEENGGRLVLLDGTHRCFLIKSVVTTIESVVIRGVTAPFPCEPQPWASVRQVDAKPPRPERFVELRPAFFRDVKRIGIDG